MENNVRTESATVSVMSANWPMISALMGGTKTMREGGKTYLPQWPNEADDSFELRRKSAVLYPAFSRTVEIMAAKPFSRPLAYGEDMPTRIREWCEDVDMQGRNLHAFASDLMSDCIAYGLSGVLVDYPPAENIRTQADAITAGVRPYFARYAPGTILGWKVEKVNGSDRLVQLRLLESVTEDDGEFGTKEVEQVRVLTPGNWQLWRKGKDDWILYAEGTTTLTEIPFVFFYGFRKGFGVGTPPLMELAFQNVEHWQSSSDQQNILHVARVPILVLVGADDSQLTVGGSAAVKVPQDGDLKYVEHSGAAIEAGRKAILDLEERMRQTGAELIVLKPGDVTATQVVSENEANKCALQRICEIFEDGLDQCLQYMAEWVGEQSGGSVSLFTDFGAASLGEASAELLLKANQSGNLSNETLFDEFKRRAILAPELEWEDEQDRIGGQGPAMGEMMEPEPVATEPQPVQQPAPEVDMAPVMNALSGINARIDGLSAKVEEPQEAEIDLSPIQSQISALAETVANLARIVATPQPQPQPIVVNPQPAPEPKAKTIRIQRDESGQIIGAEVLH